MGGFAGQQVEQMIETFDPDGNGTIDFLEFVKKVPDPGPDPQRRLTLTLTLT